MIDFSIIVCTYNRYELLHNCLTHLEGLTHSHSKNFEIIVVVNTSSKDRQDLSWSRNFANTKLVVEERTGLSVARNTGIRLATGSILIFIDDDVEAHPDWLDQLAIAFKGNPSAQLIGGKVVAKYSSMPRPLWMSAKCEALLSCVDWGNETRLALTTELLVGANSAYRRDVFDSYGLFRTNLGRKGEATLLSNEESELNARIPNSAKYYCGRAVVSHVIPPSRLKMQWFRRRVFWQAISDVMSEAEATINRDRIFDTFIAEVLRSPAEHRTVKNLFYHCETSQEFDHQLDQIYRHTIAMSVEGKSWDELL